MTPEEAKQAEERVRDFNAAKRDIFRHEKLLRVLKEMPTGDHEIVEIVINLPDLEIQYRNKKIGPALSICSLDNDEHGDLVDKFIVWARSNVEAMKRKAIKRMEDA